MYDMLFLLFGICRISGYYISSILWTLGNQTLGQSCVHDTQCTGIKSAGTCLEGMCFCDQGFDLYQLQCLPGMHAFTNSISM